MILSGKAVQRYMDAEDVEQKINYFANLHVLYEIFYLQSEDILARPTMLKRLRLERELHYNKRLYYGKESPHEDRSTRMCVFLYMVHTENQKICSTCI